MDLDKAAMDEAFWAWEECSLPSEMPSELADRAALEVAVDAYLVAVKPEPVGEGKKEKEESP